MRSLLFYVNIRHIFFFFPPLLILPIYLQQKQKRNMSEIKYSENEIPYDDFEKMGFTQEMIDDLPEYIMTKLLSGEKTPLLASNIKDANGSPLKASIWINQNEDGSLEGYYRPYDNVRDYSEFSEEQQTELLKGEVIVATLQDSPSSYYQMDENTNRILSCPQECILNNFTGLKEHVSLLDENKFKEGKRQTIEKNGNIVTIGIDLSDSKGYRIVDGDEEKWLNEKKTDTFQKYTFGLYGCWVSDDDNLSYVSEEDYSDEMQKAKDDSVKNKLNGVRF